MTDKINNEFGFDASKAISSTEKLDAALAKLESRLKSMAAATGQFNKVGTSFDQVGARGSRAMDQLANRTRRSNDTIRNAFDRWISLSGRYTTSLQLLSRITFTQLAIKGLRLTEQAFQEAIQASIAFQKQLGEIRSIDTDHIFGADLGDRLRRISSEFNVGLPDVASGAYEALSAQVLRSADDIRFLEAAAAFSKGSLTSMEASVKGLSGALNAYGQDVSNVDRLASQFNETINLGTIRGEELAHQFGTIATLGRTLGVSQAELLASIAALTNAGVPQAQAFTQVRGALVQLVKPTDALTEALRKNGIANAEQLIASRGWGESLKFLRAQTDGTTAGTAELFQNQRALLGVLSLGGTNAEFYATALERIDGVSSSLNKDRAMQVMASDAEQLTAKFNTLTNSLIPLGDGLVSVANKGIEGAGVFRDYSAAVLQFTGDLVRGKPALDQFGQAYDNLRALFGADLTVGEFGGKIVSSDEIITRRLEIAARKREDLNKQIQQDAALTAAEYNKSRFKEIDDAKAANARLIETEKDKLRQLGKLIKDNEQLRRSSQERIAALTQRRDDVQLRAQTADLSDPQKALALIQRAQSLASQAQLAMEQAARTGDQQAAQRARSLFDQADSLASEAQAVAQSAGAKDRERQAGAALAQISQQQLSAEESLSRAITARLPNLEQQQAKSKDNLATLMAAAKALQDGSSAIQAGVGPSGQIAANYERAARAAGQLSIPAAPVNRVFGGLTNYLAAGGQPRGLDTIPAMLAPGEMVISAKQTRAFFSQLQAINAGHAPVFRESGGTVNNGIIGDVSVGVTGSTYGERQTARAILGELKREIRRRGSGL